MKVTTAFIEDSIGKYFNQGDAMPLLSGFLHECSITSDEFKEWGQENLRDFQLVKQHFEAELAAAAAAKIIDYPLAKMLLEKDFGYSEKEDKLEATDALSDEERREIEYVLQSNLLNLD